MEKRVLPYKIRPIIKKKRVIIATAIYAMVVIYSSLYTGSFDFNMLIVQSIGMPFLFYFCYKSIYKTLEVNNEKLIYKGLRSLHLDYNSIQALAIFERRTNGINSYNLIIVERKNREISNIHRYRREDIERIINMISLKNEQLAGNIEDIKADLNKVKWISS